MSTYLTCNYSHWHWDHLGDPSRFPSCTELVVGPGFKDSFLPGYPAKKDAPVRESDFALVHHISTNEGHIAKSEQWKNIARNQLLQE